MTNAEKLIIRLNRCEHIRIEKGPKMDPTVGDQPNRDYRLVPEFLVRCIEEELRENSCPR